jgi:hypothetical protein
MSMFSLESGEEKLRKLGRSTCFPLFAEEAQGLEILSQG